ncbi:MAG TPA: Flp family type IVb pilin [Desulfotomaculum sp.]|nr:MAG: hypothetical protein JL56_12255 [Desulfotomaculum sp. BICA1-6]HBX23177.1 Flp family type IVb pilin [Desulfotomaculum sp.]
MTLVSRLWNEESGQGMAEYGLILALVAVICIVGFQFLGKEINNKVDAVGDEIVKDRSATTTP